VRLGDTLAVLGSAVLDPADEAGEAIPVGDVGPVGEHPAARMTADSAGMTSADRVTRTIGPP
jgi:hypothetical protein